MFRCYVTPREISAILDISKLNMQESQISSKIQGASWVVSSELKRKDYDLSRIYIPNMFDALTPLATITASNHESNSISGNGNQRFVIQFIADTATPADFSLLGEIGGGAFVPVIGIDGNPVKIQCNEKGLYTRVFSDVFSSFKYTLETETPVEYSAYLVDTSLDYAIIQKTICTILEPIAKQGTQLYDFYELAEALYLRELQNIRIPYDANDNGDITPDEKLHKTEINLLR